MLRSMQELVGYRIHATDGNLGKVVDFYFDDTSWTTRYLIADTAHWLNGHKVLISTHVLRRPQWALREFPVALSREQVRNSPDVDTQQSVSRSYEVELHRHYGWQNYWGTGGMMGYPFEYDIITPNPSNTAEGYLRQHEVEKYRIPTGEEHDDRRDEVKSHIRSLMEIRGYGVHASDGKAGSVTDLIVEDTDWIIRYLVTDLQQRSRRREVLVPPLWADRISWKDTMIYLPFTRQFIEECPEYVPTAAVNREYEEVFYDYYGHKKY